VGSGGGGNDVNWLNHGRGFISAYFARRRIRLEVLAATEAELKRRGVAVPSRPVSRPRLLLLVLLVVMVVVVISFAFRS
jgi:hypothetical protein